MALTTTLEMLLDAQKRGYAVGAFNVENMEMAQAVIRAAEKKDAPVVIQTTPGTLKYAEPAVFYGIVQALAKKVKAPVALHLDHGDSYELAARCLMAGYTSVMIDGSRLQLQDNIALSARVAALAALNGVPVEAELGKVGGKEDTLADQGDEYTNPADAAAFVKASGVQSLAVAIGTAHGVYKTKPVLDVKRLHAIREVVEIPLVLHGASGLSEEQVVSCVKEGICKVNFATELRIAYTKGVGEAMAQKPIDPKAYGKAGRERVQALVEKWMDVCGATGRA
ncbi:MAG: class II fructose-bisphosphate aldolase [Eubacteriales bacterium]|nr:class II fructose-bisphosphate aldolase [Eubacteriales bacterium]